ncbi:hypothetical protein [Mycobacterium palustre]|uniref:Uncharacterized protein n=1 Tax=Mycobacterium palustre TaxID=153971 RepID=A0A1X1ZIV7_9MYCO|nr:hypothetical protein [Mycobacterium palustre]MCV7102776.1 hypothetical protein [Mycobacterium palustre]ORW23268.1 hypothetical protein AWC19_11970 [Mycobacterium palustre]
MSDYTAMFTDAELRTLATAPGDRAAAALDHGDVDGARDTAKNNINKHFVLRDIYVSWNALTLGYIEREFGSAALTDAISAALATIARPWAEWFRNGVSREAVSSLAMIFRMDAGELAAVEEDEDTIVLVSEQWAAARADAIPGAPDLRLVTSEIERLCCQWLGYPPFVFEAGTGGAPLRLTIHKDPLNIPATVFERLGMPRDEARIGAAFSVSGALLFDEDEREAMCHPALVLALTAIDAGDFDLARRHFALSKTEWYPAHHFARDLIAALTGWIYEHHGVEHCWESVEQCYNRPAMGPMMAQVAQIPMRERVIMLADLFHQHGMKYTMTEMEGGVRMHTAPCGSGGRLIDEGAYAPPKGLPIVRGKGVETFSLDEMPVYCMHCPATNKLVLESDGPYFLLVEPGLKDGRITGHCDFYVFHSEADVPQAMYDRVGVTRPSAVTNGA